MSAIRKSPWFACAVVALLAAGCGEQPAQVKVTNAGAGAVANQPAAARSTAPMPSYPILLVDLPRYDAGQSVPPARSRGITAADRDMDGPSFSASRGGPAASSVVSAPALRLVTPRPSETVDTRYVP